MRRPFLLAAAVVAVQACASGSTAATAGGTTRQQTTARTTVITAQELAENPDLNSVADAVRKLRPGWRAATVFINSDPYVGSASEIPVRNVREIRFLSASQAQMNWGSRYREVIQVITR
jgi:outer membrane receptor for ferrienterochelin and colicin